MNRGSNHSFSRRRAISWTIAAGLLLAASIVGWRWSRSRQAVRGLERCREPVEALEASRRISDFFSRNRMALSEGLIDLGRSDLSALEGDLRILERLLEDDGLLEEEVHRRPPAAAGRKVSFSAHDWLAGEEAESLRGRLPSLLVHPSQAVRSLAASCLALLGAKVPEALAAEPLPWFRREHTQALLELLGGTPPGPAAAIHPFLREVLREPAALRLWEKGAGLGRQEALSIAIRALAALDGPIGGELAGALRSLKDLPVPDRALQARELGRSTDPQAWSLLVQLAARDQPASVRLEAIAALKVSAPAEAIPLLKELAAQGDSWAEKIREAVEHISGERMVDWAQVRAEPGRLGALRTAPETQAEAARVISALRFHGLRPEAARRDSEARRRIVALLACPLPEARAEAARTAGRAGMVEAIAGSSPQARPAPTSPGGPAPAGSGTLIGLLLDPDFRVATAAASALFEITAFWPPEEGGEFGEPGGLSLATASDPARSRRWAIAWEKWWAKDGGRGAADWLLEGLESPEPLRAARGARGLAALESRGGIDAPWYTMNAPRILEAFPRLPAGARTPVLEVLAAREDPGRPEALWSLYAAAFRMDPAAAWEVLAAIHRLLARGAAGDGNAVLEALVARLGGEEGSSSVLLAGYIDSRFAAPSIDEALLAAIRALPPASSGAPGAAAREEAMERLVRWFPRSPDRAKAQVLIDLLSDPGPRTRFWAFQHLSAMAGQDFGFDPKSPGAGQAASIGRFRAWAGRLSDPLPGK